ncbi:HNH endonuclease [Sphingomonas psychrotolerans]|uniref:HNH endonuclease n=1 Tax=Sphingomonas psychrotolerans TaxID=1327635 RepID=A0ABU3N494_9SPHN|nr:HNH endonuclease [Sphingomonas psychrotolerans]MDT8759081.1 HNH endonuclease [Sphingomonas psychrotolerans]
MGGRVRRKAALAALDRQPAVPPDRVCALCGRPLGARIEWHHVVPKSEGGRDTVPVHPICHRIIHATVSNAELARLYPTFDQLREHEDIRRFLAWIADKPPDFHAPTRRKPR